MTLHNAIWVWGGTVMLALFALAFLFFIHGQAMVALGLFFGAVRDGATHTTDGPFAETKEQLGGYYILDCDNLDEAIEYAAKIPSAAFGSIEVRPVMVFE